MNIKQINEKLNRILNEKEYKVTEFISDLKELITINSNLEKDGIFFNNIKEIKQNNNELVISFENGKVIKVIAQ